MDSESGFPVIEALAALGGGLAANAANIYMNERNNRWKERMANTAHQREVRDLRAAGLNPILSATGGSGAPVPNLTPGTVENPVPQALEAGFTARRLDMEKALNSAQVGKLVGEANASYQSIEESKKRIELMEAQRVAASASARAMDRSKPIDQLINEAVQPLLELLRTTKKVTDMSPFEATQHGLGMLGFDVGRPGLVTGVVEKVKNLLGWDKAERVQEKLDKRPKIEVWNPRTNRYEAESEYDRNPGQRYGGPNGARR